MRLVDFKLSTADLDQQLPLYWEKGPQRLAIQQLQLTGPTLILTVASTGRPITLDQFSAQTRRVSGLVQLVVDQPDKTVPLFGYRLSNHQLLFG